jgi:hypothetical protein
MNVVHGVNEQLGQPVPTLECRRRRRRRRRQQLDDWHWCNLGLTMRNAEPAAHIDMSYERANTC